MQGTQHSDRVQGSHADGETPMEGSIPDQCSAWLEAYQQHKLPIKQCHWMGAMGVPAANAW